MTGIWASALIDAANQIDERSGIRKIDLIARNIIALAARSKEAGLFFLARAGIISTAQYVIRENPVSEIIARARPKRSFAIPGVYFLIDRGTVVYVGQSANLPLRLDSHIQEGSKEFDEVSFIAVPLGFLNQVETYYIKELNPKYNKTLVCGFQADERGLSPNYLTSEIDSFRRFEDGEGI